MADILVIGGGLGGLACAALCARRGQRVRLLERSKNLGGRGKSAVVEGGTLNLGPHALYLKAAGAPVLHSLGIQPRGKKPPTTGKVLLNGRLDELPGDPFSLLRTGALTHKGRLSLSLFLSTLPLSRPTGSVQTWLAPLPADTRRLVEALVRVSSYCNAPDRMDAGFAADQLWAALAGGVMYLDGGWGQLVEALTGVAEGAGVQIQLGQAVERVEERKVFLEDGSSLSADHVVVATPPEAARRMGLPWAEGVTVRAACLDLLLSAQPNPENRFVLGLDSPVYLSEHTGIAALGPHHVVHVAKYLAPNEGIEGVEEELEALMSLAIPGWEKLLVAKKWRGALPVCANMPEAGQHRPEIQIAPGLWRVGDGVGERGLLLDASLASAAAVAEKIG
ncbi:MAG TPA: FAD-dependent oxidoreductase [Myxococcota bacterium]|nr:FAD-dependent oxidoreductase [Myxococcota bacterium]